jgi:hypothetical protein
MIATVCDKPESWSIQPTRSAQTHGVKLPDREVERQRDEDIDRRAAETSRLETPLLGSGEGLSIEAFRIQRADDANSRRTAGT